MGDMLYAAERYGIPLEEIITDDERDPNYYLRQNILRDKKEDKIKNIKNIENK
jgi:hypothetical protein